MEPLTAPATQTNPGPQAARGRWIWRLSGVCTVIMLGLFGTWAIVRAGTSGGGTPVHAVPERIVTIPQAVTGVDVSSYGKAPRTVQVTTSGGPADLELPGGPYAVTAQSFGGPERVTVPVSPAASSTVSVSTDSGGLRITPPGAGT